MLRVSRIKIVACAVLVIMLAPPLVGGVLAQEILYIANYVGNSVTSYQNPATVNGNIAPATNLLGATTGLAFPADIVVNSAGELMACNFLTNAVTVYAHAATDNGNVLFSRNVQGAATLISGPATLAISTTNDLLFVGNITTNLIHVYAGASTATFNGNLAPTRTINSPDMVGGPYGINFGAGDELFVASHGNSRILVFANASTAGGVVNATRIIGSAAFSANIFDVYVDADDNLYVVNGAGAAPANRINIFHNASTRSGLATAPDVTLVVTGAISLTAVAVDADGVGYIVDNGANAVLQYDNIATRNGTFGADRTIVGGNTQLNSPIRVFLSATGATHYTYYPDADGDTYGAATGAIDSTSATPPAGYVTSSTDCNDANAAVHPGATEICTDSIDNNCNGLVDSADTVPCPGGCGACGVAGIPLLPLTLSAMMGMKLIRRRKAKG
jgi:sugar lactone lactonase YvrE